MKRANEIFRFLLGAGERGEPTALVTLTDVLGSSSRAPGTHLAVSASGGFAGSISGGCVEAAIVGEIQRVIANGHMEQLRFGAESRFIDIRLPCGGAIDLLVLPHPPINTIKRAFRALGERKRIALRMSASGELSIERTDRRHSGWEGEDFLARHWPDLRLVIAGHGTETEALARLAQAYGAEVTVLTPDAAIAKRIAASGTEVHFLAARDPSSMLTADPDTAIVFLFHDHDWEEELILQALGQAPFYIGAMGSRGTHAIRLERLRARGVGSKDLARIQGPIGLIAATRDPDTLALSTLAEIAEFYGNRREGHDRAIRKSPSPCR